MEAQTHPSCLVITTVLSLVGLCLFVEFIFSRIKKGEGQGKEKCHAKSMMSKETNERLKRDTQHVPLRQNTEEKIREKGLKVV